MARNDWPFDQAPGAAAVTTAAVVAGAPIVLVVHFAEDHSWAFLDGAPFDISAGRLIAMSEALQLDRSVSEIADLQPGWCARREGRGSTWVRSFDTDASSDESGS